MPKITVLPHEQLCPEGKTFEVHEGASLARALLANGIRIEHACEFSGACSTCHVIIREGLIHSMNLKMKNLTVWIKLGG